MLGIFTKNGKETPEPLKAKITGTVPDWLQGTLVRNGPAQFSFGNTDYTHWFDGMALIHNFTFKDGEVYYRSKFLKSETFKTNSAANRIVVSEFGTMAYPDPCKNIFSKAFTYLSNIIPDFTDNGLVNVIRYGQDFYAASEINYINRVDPHTLETLGRTDYRNHIALNLATAHPHYDKEGNTYNMGTAVMYGIPKYMIFRVPANASGEDHDQPPLSKLEKVCSIPCRSKLYPSYFHSFGMTENYIVFVEQAFKLDIIKLATAYFRGVNWGSCIKLDNNDITVFHLFDRRTGESVSTKYCGDPFVVFHHINAYEEDNHVVFDLITYKDSNLYDMFYIANLKQETDQFIENNKIFSPPVCQRFVLPLITVDKDTPKGTNLVTLEDTTATAVLQTDGSVFCSPDPIFVGLELPQINYKFNTKKYRYFYGSRVEWSPYPNKIAKVDILNRTHKEWIEEQCYPSEPVFVASPDAVEEDDGVLLSSIVSGNPEKSPFMLILNAKTMEEIARAAVDTSVHMDLHGYFIPSTGQ